MKKTRGIKDKAQASGLVVGPHEWCLLTSGHNYCKFQSPSYLGPGHLSNAILLSVTRQTGLLHATAYLKLIPTLHSLFSVPEADFSQIFTSLVPSCPSGP